MPHTPLSPLLGAPMYAELDFFQDELCGLNVRRGNYLLPEVNDQDDWQFDLECDIEGIDYDFDDFCYDPMPVGTVENFGNIDSPQWMVVVDHNRFGYEIYKPLRLPCGYEMAELPN